MGIASVLWELECCLVRAHETLTNLQERRPNHFGVFRGALYAREIRVLDTKMQELVEQAKNPKEETRSSMGSVKSLIRNCVARLWWADRVGEDIDTVEWATFIKIFQEDFEQQPAEAINLLRKHLASYCESSKTKFQVGGLGGPVSPDPGQKTAGQICMNDPTGSMKSLSLESCQESN
ncbi:unnamed protein product, partial [Choristocarpus tenellus]